MKEDTFKQIAKRHLKSLFLFLLACLLVTIFSVEMREWTNNHSGWQSQVIFGLFTIIGTIAFLAMIMFGALIYEWFQYYKMALSDSKSNEFDRMKQLYKSVLGPIPWR